MKDFVVTILFTHKSGIVTVGRTLFPSRTSKKAIVKRIKEILDEGGSPVHCITFLTTYTNIDEVVWVLAFTPTGTVDFLYERKVK